MATQKEKRKDMLARVERLHDYCLHLYAVGMRPPLITEKAMEINEPSPLFFDRTNKDTCYRIVRRVVEKIESEWAQKQALMHPHATGAYLTKKEKMEASLWPLATARTRTTIREYMAIDPLTEKPRRVRETITDGPHPIVQAAAIRELGKTLDDIAMVLGVDVRGKRGELDPLEDLFRLTTDSLLEAHEERKREQLERSAIDVPVTSATNADDDGEPETGPRGGPTNNTVM